MTARDQPARTQHSTTVAQKSAHELTVTRTFDSPARTVFDAWTRPEQFRQWWAPKSMGAELTACDIDARTGGGYRITFGAGPESATFFGRYVEVTAPSRLVWTNDETADAPVTTVTFEDRGDQTLLVLSERYPDAGSLPDAVAGMQAMAAEQFAQLDALLASLPRDNSLAVGDPAVST
ncbi:SRPBCC domain-containing protein [Phenylobacterium sp.]|jgi:uncharacterized protein YndB with AHSA1/START domain|uniref:SRPBCC domain-containing protein n=1 Tax=Phenylobacterium sp. TaxID=1871053 RepID=UPI003783B6FC